MTNNAFYYILKGFFVHIHFSPDFLANIGKRLDVTNGNADNYNKRIARYLKK